MLAVDGTRITAVNNKDRNTSLLESLEGKRGQVRAKPPLPAISGLFGRPTVINNVLSFASVPWILEHGARAYADCGVGLSLGTGGRRASSRA